MLLPQLLALRQIYSGALNAAVAERCGQALGLGDGDSGGELKGDLEGLRRRVHDTRWTTPEIAFAYHVGLREEKVEPSYAAAVVAGLVETVRNHEPPALQMPAGRDEGRWISYGLGVFAADRDREGQEAVLAQREATEADHTTVQQALELLDKAWPPMAGAIRALIRRIVWFVPVRGTGPRSATLIQAFGAIFLSPRGDVTSMVDDLVHETTHLDVIMRFSVDKLVTNPGERGTSPFRQNERPLTRVLHAAVVSARRCEALGRCGELLVGDAREAFRSAREQAEGHLNTALETLRAKAEWTPAGEVLMQSLDDFAERRPQGWCVEQTGGTDGEGSRVG